MLQQMFYSLRDNITALKICTKCALMQTAFACGGGLRPPHPRQGACLPLDPAQPCAGWMPGTFRRSIAPTGADPLPVDPHPTVCRLDTQQGFRALHHAEGLPAPATPANHASVGYAGFSAFRAGAEL